MVVGVYIHADMLKPGEIVTPRLPRPEKELFLWADGQETIVGSVIAGSVCIVLKVESFEHSAEFIQEEWKKGACLLLGPTGQIGWTGAGWLRRLPSSSKA